MSMSEIEEMIKEFGEQNRVLVTDALTWLNEREPAWELPRPLNHAERREYIKELIRYAVKVHA
jgi:hypothetical protein